MVESSKFEYKGSQIVKLSNDNDDTIDSIASTFIVRSPYGAISRHKLNTDLNYYLERIPLTYYSLIYNGNFLFTLYDKYSTKEFVLLLDIPENEKRKILDDIEQYKDKLYKDLEWGYNNITCGDTKLTRSDIPLS